MQPHQQRVVDEKKELDIKRDRLAEFMKGATFHSLDNAEQARLSRQAAVMSEYSNILSERIAAFKVDKKTNEA